MSKETFKVFARSHPELATQVINNTTSWQKLYELYQKQQLQLQPVPQQLKI